MLRVAAELLAANGVGGLSVDDVCRQSGVAKTTIYRHWPARSDLIVEACSRLDAGQRVPDTGSFDGDLTALLSDIAALLLNARWSSVLPSIVDAAERDPGLAAVHSRIQKGHAAPFQMIIARATARGELPPTADPAVLVAAALGSLFYRRWFSREPLDADFVNAVVRLVSQPR